jgi:hypothetical protein
MSRLFAVIALAACGSSSARPDAFGGADASAPADSGTLPTTDAAIDSPGVDCFYDWSTRGTCGAPVIDAAYLTTDCEATTGVFVVGHGFESANQFMTGNGWLPYGPKATSEPLNDNIWNVLTPTLMCITTSANPAIWSGFTLQLQNPDGQLSNSVTVQNLLSARPALVSTGSDDAFDPDACLDTGMTHDQALAMFAMGASTSMLGRLAITAHTRSCNSATGCLAWGAPATIATNVPAGLAITGNGSAVDFTLGSADCGSLGHADETLAYNYCDMADQGYAVHVAAHCLQLSATVRSPIAPDGSYSQTDTVGLVRY